MCFTVNVNLIKEELENRYGATLIDPDKYRPSYYYHAFGLPSLPVICSDSPSSIKLLKWGLIPSWTKSIDEANVISDIKLLMPDRKVLNRNLHFLHLSGQKDVLSR